MTFYDLHCRRQRGRSLHISLIYMSNISDYCIDAPISWKIKQILVSGDPIDRYHSIGQLDNIDLLNAERYHSISSTIQLRLKFNADLYSIYGIKYVYIYFFAD